MRFSLTPAQVDRFWADPATLAVGHPHYVARTELSGATKASLVEGLLG